MGATKLSQMTKKGATKGTVPLQHDKTVPFIAPFYRQLAELGVATPHLSIKNLCPKQT